MRNKLLNIINKLFLIAAIENSEPQLLKGRYCKTIRHTYRRMNITSWSVDIWLIYALLEHKYMSKILKHKKIRLTVCPPCHSNFQSCCGPDHQWPSRREPDSEVGFDRRSTAQPCENPAHSDAVRQNVWRFVRNCANCDAAVATWVVPIRDKAENKLIRQHRLILCWDSVLTDIHFQPGRPARARKCSTCSSGDPKLGSWSREVYSPELSRSFSRSLTLLYSQ